MSRLLPGLCVILLFATAGRVPAQDADAFVDTSGDCFEKIPSLLGASLGAYRAPLEADVQRSDEWDFVRGEYGVEATCLRQDFDLDGRVDYASILIRRDERAFGLAIFTAQVDGSYGPELLLKDAGDPELLWSTRLGILRPGRNEGVFGCSGYDGERQSINLRFPAIQLWARARLGTPEHWLFHWRAQGGYERTSLCSVEAWQELLRNDRDPASECSGCKLSNWDVERDAVASADHPLAGFWKHGSCAGQPFGLAIGPMGSGKYYVSFCGPGGCFPKGAYRPVTTLRGDSDFNVIDDDTIDMLDRGGERWVRCEGR